MARWIEMLQFSAILFNVFALDYKLNGKSYIVYTPLWRIASDGLTVQLLFRTRNSSGVLVHAKGRNGRFMTLEIVRGKLRYASAFGGGSSRPGTHEVIIGDDLSDNQWHQIDIEKNKFHVKIILDVTRKYLKAEPMVEYQAIAVAGLPPNTPKRTTALPRKHTLLPTSQVGPKDPSIPPILKANPNYPSLPPTSPSISKYPSFSSLSIINPIDHSLPPISLTGSNFKGCIEDVIFNEINIFKATKVKSKNVQVFGKLWPKCSEDAKYYEPATFTTSISHIRLQPLNNQDVTSLKFTFRTFDNTGVLVRYGFDSNEVLFLELKKGKLMFSCTSKNFNSSKIISHQQTSLADGLWHDIDCNITPKSVSIQINNERFQTFLPTANLRRNATLIIGTSTYGEKPSFKGCVKKITLNGKDINIPSSITQDVNVDQCYLTDLCFINPCLNKGECEQYNNSLQCDCRKTSFTGALCQNIRPTAIMADELPGTLKSASNSTIKPEFHIQTTAKEVYMGSQRQFSSPNEQNITTGQLNQATTTGKPKKVYITTYKRIYTLKPGQFTTKEKRKDFLSAPTTKTIVPIRETLISSVTQATNPSRILLATERTSTNRKISSIQINRSKAPTTKMNESTRTTNNVIVQQKETLIRPTIRMAATLSLSKSQERSTIHWIQTMEQNSTYLPHSPKTERQALPTKPTQLNLHSKEAFPTAHKPFFTSNLLKTQPENPSNKTNTQIIIIEKSNTITKVGFNKNQLLVYVFLLIVLILFVGLVVLISAKRRSFINACSCMGPSQSVNPKSSQDSIELGHQQRKDLSFSLAAKRDRPSSVNDSGIDRSSGAGDLETILSGREGLESSLGDEGVADFNLDEGMKPILVNRGSIESSLPNCNDLGTSVYDRGELEASLSDHGDVETSSQKHTGGFLILQEDPSFYTQKSFGWTILSDSNTIRYCRTSTRDLIHAVNENRPPAFRPSFYLDSEIFKDIGVDAKKDDTHSAHRMRKYRQLTTSDCSSMDTSCFTDTEQCSSPEIRRLSEDNFE